eukprot:TRINITY_DN9938_c0_g2_i1.p2 TRINITY_DN9938_c0_g2~~TRINITY_DN9938_c0_g2_i1.p2  ORF type:complete len:215 (+),score=56.65 TRINITY_DN9938_c0_g2_i1:187-831(+)
MGCGGSSDKEISKEEDTAKPAAAPQQASGAPVAQPAAQQHAAPPLATPQQKAKPSERYAGEALLEKLWKAVTAEKVPGNDTLMKYTPHHFRAHTEALAWKRAENPDAPEHYPGSIEDRDAAEKALGGKEDGISDSVNDQLGLHKEFQKNPFEGEVHMPLDVFLKWGEVRAGVYPLKDVIIEKLIADSGRLNFVKDGTARDAMIAACLGETQEQM